MEFLYIILIILMGTFSTLIAVLVIFSYFNYQTINRVKDTVLRAEMQVIIDLKNKLLIQTGVCQLPKKTQNFKIIISIEEILKKKLHRSMNPDFTRLLEKIISYKSSLNLVKKSFEIVSNNSIDFISKSNEGSSYSSIWLSSIDEKQKLIVGTSNMLLSNKDNLFELRKTKLAIVSDINLVHTLTNAAKKVNKNKLGLIKISADVSTRIHNVGSTGISLFLASFVDFLNKTTNLIAYQSNMTTIYVILKPKNIKNVETETKQISHEIQSTYKAFTSENYFSKNTDWIISRYTIISNKTSIEIGEALSRIAFKERRSIDGFDGNVENLPTLLRELIKKISLQLKNEKLNILQEISKLSNNEKLIFLLPDILPYEYNLLIEKTMEFKHILIEYMIRKASRLARKNPKFKYVITLHFSFTRHLLEKKYRIPENLIITFSVKDIKDGLFYDQLVNLRAIKNKLNYNFGLMFNKNVPIILEVAYALAPKYIFVTRAIHKERRSAFETEYIYGQLSALSERSDITNLYTIV